MEHWRHVWRSLRSSSRLPWGFYVFVYQERIKPALEQPNVQYTLAISHQRAGRTKELISIQQSWKDLGTVNVQVDGYIMNVYGVRYSDASPRVRADRRLDIFRRGYIAPVVLIRNPSARRTLQLSHFLTPSAELYVNESIVVPHREFDTLIAEYTSSSIRGALPTAASRTTR